MYGGWPEKWKYTPGKGIGPCEWADLVIMVLRNNKEQYLAELKEFGQNLKAVTPEFDRAVDNYVASVIAAAADGVTSLIKGPKGVADSLASVVGAVHSREQYDQAVQTVMEIRARIEEAEKWLRDNDQDLALVRRKRESLPCPR